MPIPNRRPWLRYRDQYMAKFHDHRRNSSLVCCILYEICCQLRLQDVSHCYLYVYSHMMFTLPMVYSVPYDCDS